MSPEVARRVVRAIIIGAVLIGVVVLLIVFADLSALRDESPRCGASFLKSQWPRYFGCAMSTHADLASGLIGGAGALFAAWLAFDAIQEQIRGEEAQRIRQESGAKKVATFALVRPVVYAGLTAAEV